MTTIALVACSGAKLKRPAAARDLYTSQLFKKASALAEVTSDEWFILSAKHGLLRPDTIIEPYDMKLGGKNGPPIWDWAALVSRQLRLALDDMPLPIVTIYAGEQYRTILRREFPWAFSVPMRHMGIGQQLAYLTHQLDQVNFSVDV